jgi:aspartyl-tRNA(Asn)/glutamyl-tRNA(Gln) amidotransferase subunit A
MTSSATTDLCFLTIWQISQMLRTKQVSPTEITQATLERIDRLNPSLNSYITVLGEQAMADARAAEQEIAGGSHRGPLHGVPIAVKDLCATKGIRTTAASKILASNVPEGDSEVVTRLRTAGAIIIGKANLHEFAFGATGVSPHFGPARNPWDTERVTGGSSSGSGNSVAAGLCFGAIGSDTGGSIRMPSSLCGTAGIKPTYGRVSLLGTIPLSWSLDHLGPMARSARDCALMLEAIAGHDARDPSSATAAVERWSDALDGTIRGLRIGVPTEFAFERAEQEISSIVQAAISTLESLGAEVRHLDLPVLNNYWVDATRVLLAEAATYHADYLKERPGDYGEDVRTRLQAGAGMKATDYVRARQCMDEARRGAADEALFSDVDLLAMPTTVRPAVPIDSITVDDPTLGYTWMTAAFDLTGQPAISVPCGLTKDSLPVGLQLVGRSFDETAVFRAAHAYEGARGPWPWPPVDG